MGKMMIISVDLMTTTPLAALIMTIGCLKISKTGRSLVKNVVKTYSINTTANNNQIANCLLAVLVFE